jgi:dipeptidyl aminopeptidase/acylaminoacyl peptidase
MLHYKFTVPFIILLALLPHVAPAQPAVGNLTVTDLASPDATVEASLPRYLETRSARFIDWSADGSLLLATRFDDTEQVHRVRAPLSMREQLSFEASGVLAAAAQPGHAPWNAQGFVYLSPRDGGEHTALLWQAQAGQPATALTDGKFRDGAALWSHDGQRIAFSSNRGTAGSGPPAGEREIDVLDISSPAAVPRLIAGGAGYRWRLFDWSLDDQRLLLGRESLVTGGDAELFVANVGSAALTPLLLAHKAVGKGPAPAPTPWRTRAARFASDGRGVLLLTTGAAAGDGTGSAEFSQLRYLDLASGESRTLASETQRDVELFDESADGHFVAYTINDGESSRLGIIDQQRKLDLNIAALPPGIISNLKFDATGKRLALTLESARSPRDVYVLEPETQQLTRWTHSELGPLDPEGLVTPALVRYPTWDHVEGQSRLLMAYAYHSTQPAAINPMAPRPVLILLRTGGGTQFRPGFDPLVQYLVNELGFVVLAPNVRGASGYGRSFAELAQGALHDDAARDIGSLLVWIGLQHDLDFNHILIMGEGYGSTLALTCLAQYGDRLRGGIAAFPPHLAPNANLAMIRRPVLVVHGRSDPDAPAYESEQLAARLRANGAPVQYLGAADEAAEFLRHSNRNAYYEAVANFLAQLLR